MSGTARFDALVTVVIPAFDPGDYLRTALESVIAQTYAVWECIVVDDGSSEDLGWVEQFDARVTCIRQHNRGVSAARNTGVASARGRYIAFLDADDVWLPEKLERQLAAWQPGASMSATGFFRFGEGSRQAGWVPRAATRDELIRGNSICMSSVIVDRARIIALGGFDERLRSAEDWDMWLRLVVTGRLIAVDEVLTGYRIHEVQASGHPARMWLWSVLVVLKQRAPFLPSIAGILRMGTIYGSQVFERFRVTRNVGHLLLASVMTPRYVVGELVRLPLRRLKGISRSGRR